MVKLRKIHWIILGVLFAFASLAINYQVKFRMHEHGSGSVTELGNIKVGEPAPDFTLNDLSGQPVSLNSFRGKKVVLLDFWATWCGPCRMAMPDLQEINDQFKNVGFEILSINEAESAADVRPFIESRKFSFHVVLDTANSVGDQYGVQGIPTLVLIDKNGIVRSIQVGYSPYISDLTNSIGTMTQVISYERDPH